MSSFNCEHCGEPILDTPRGYVTGCKHYPLSGEGAKSAWGTTYRMYLCKGYDHGAAANFADEYCRAHGGDE